MRRSRRRSPTAGPPPSSSSRSASFNEFFAEGAQDFGIVMQGGLYNSVLRSLEDAGPGRCLRPVAGAAVRAQHHLPADRRRVQALLPGKRGILLVEEGQPDFIEQSLNSLLRKADVQTKVHGKDVLPMAGEYTGGVVLKGVARFHRDVCAPLLEGRELPAAAQKASSRPGR
jgi:indolepyruvate ferredoxin oxidoreductase alpha subunit